MGWNKSDIKTKAPTEAYRKGFDAINWGRKPKSIGRFLNHLFEWEEIDPDPKKFDTATQPK